MQETIETRVRNLTFHGPPLTKKALSDKAKTFEESGRTDISRVDLSFEPSHAKLLECENYERLHCFEHVAGTPVFACQYIANLRPRT